MPLKKPKGTYPLALDARYRTTPYIIAAKPKETTACENACCVAETASAYPSAPPPAPAPRRRHEPHRPRPHPLRQRDERRHPRPQRGEQAERGVRRRQRLALTHEPRRP